MMWYDITESVCATVMALVNVSSQNQISMATVQKTVITLPIPEQSLRLQAAQ